MGVERKLIRKFGGLVNNIASLSLAIEALEDLLIARGTLIEGELMEHMLRLAEKKQKGAKDAEPRQSKPSQNSEVPKLLTRG